MKKTTLVRRRSGRETNFPIPLILPLDLIGWLFSLPRPRPTKGYFSTRVALVEAGPFYRASYPPPATSGPYTCFLYGVRYPSYAKLKKDDIMVLDEGRHIPRIVKRRGKDGKMHAYIVSDSPSPQFEISRAYGITSVDWLMPDGEAVKECTWVGSMPALSRKAQADFYAAFDKAQRRLLGQREQ